jgi:PadR family transcriptional regulator, regulatory protein PadR
LYVFVLDANAISRRGNGMTREALGEFEQMVLLAILQLGDGVYGVPIVDEIQRRTGRSVAPAAVYVTLRRLEQKGLLTSWMGESTPERGGKSRRCVKVTGVGLESLRESRKVLENMWKGLDPKLRRAQ